MSVLLLTISIFLSSRGLASPLPKYKSDVGLNASQMIGNRGYLCENHDITTEDGYILTYQRIPHGISNHNGHKKPVLVMHGLLAASETFLFMGPEHSLGYILADLGYDVWLANARGNSWSRRHNTLDVILDNEKFYDFSWHEMGYYDLPAAIDYILNVTKRDELDYIGHSQGGTAFLVMASTRPQYNKKVKLASLLAPASFMEHVSIPFAKPLAGHVYELEILFKFFRIYEVPFISESRRFLAVFCSRPQVNVICNILNRFFFNTFTKEMEEFAAVSFSGAPSNSGIRQLLHYLQLIRNGGFRQYDYGIFKNLLIYGENTPPSYNLSKISTPVAIFYSLGDRIVNHLDIQMSIQRLPNVVYEYLGSYDLGHPEMICLKQIIGSTEGALIKAMHRYG